MKKLQRVTGSLGFVALLIVGAVRGTDEAEPETRGLGKLAPEGGDVNISIQPIGTGLTFRVRAGDGGGSNYA